MMGADETNNELRRRWSFLLDWISDLYEHVAYIEREELDCLSLHSELRSLCVYIPLPPATTDAYSQKLRKLREAIELVGLMLRVDKRSWQLLQHRETMHDFDPDDYDDSDLQPHFMVKAYPRKDCRQKKAEGDSVKSIAACAQLLLGKRKAPLSYAFERARDQIFQQDRTDRLLRGYQVPISVVFGPKPMRDQLVTSYIEHATSIVSGVVQEMNTVRPGSGEPAYPFRLTKIVFQPWDFRLRLDENELCEIDTFIRKTLNLGVDVAEVAVKLVDPDPVALYQLMDAVALPCETSDDSYARKPGGVQALMVTSTSLNAFAAVCSMLCEAGTFGRVHFFAAFDDTSNVAYRREKWKWLGYALCSRASTTVIEEVYIDDDRLLLSDVSAIKRVVNSHTPVQALTIDRDDDDEEDDDDDDDNDDCVLLGGVDREIQLSSQAQIRIHTADAVDTGMNTLGIESDAWFPVINDGRDGEWMEILVPGYGRGYARCANIINAQRVEHQRRSSKLRTLRLAFNNCERRAVGAMVRAIGADLVSLDVDMSDSSFVNQADISAIIDACPHLKMLRLKRARIGTMNVFTRAYEEQRCKITVLALSNVDVSNASLHAFARVLADPTHIMAATLEEFRYIYDDVGCVGDIARPDEAGIQLFLDMLLSNRVLSFVEIGMEEHVHERFADQFRDLDGTLLVSHPSHLPSKAKLALLSCMVDRRAAEAKRSRGSTSTVGIPRLSRAMVRRIFEFARKRIHRVVSPTFISDDDHVEAIFEL